jgi:hypothetical protein
LTLAAFHTSNALHLVTSDMSKAEAIAFAGHTATFFPIILCRRVRSDNSAIWYIVRELHPGEHLEHLRMRETDTLWELME